MKKITLLLTFSFLFCYSFAQNYKKRTPEEKARYYTDQMETEIKLEENQKEKIYQINLVVSQQFDSLYATKPDQDASRRGAIGIYKKRDAAFRKILSNTQFLMFDDIQREKREKKRKETLEKENQKKAETNTDSIKVK